MTTSNPKEIVEQILQARWHSTISGKAQTYVGQFFDAFTLRQGVYAKVQGNHGIYRVSIFPGNKNVSATCSCYIGKSGYCHHCEALAHAFLLYPETFTAIPKYTMADVSAATTPERIHSVVRSLALAAVIEELEQNNMNLKGIAVSMGVSEQKIRSLIKKERQQGIIDDLTPLKLACVWLLQKFGSRGA
ncbi:hypothetical protein [Candidatus Viridilinea mediisalina]|uniref:SWIM-type domain-containing protein n=1 Tax=Candidatus Viridilinea mediisalina TaxID=2024553 RepID=A0A2A6REA9_9CHLR|nr:hypothetical protein [Candidatus Viridilinea mediisalina]PDW00642.1 hypothetical protein CJ255_20430 [Candidatus Viridilinea mediisalina]